MKALILAAGYAARLYPITKDKPKPLLTIRKKPIIEYIIQKLEKLEQVDEIMIVTNQKFFSQFRSWLENFPSLKPISLLKDNSRSTLDRCGAIGDIAMAIQQENINDDLLVVAGDNLFSFSLRPFIEFALTRRPQASIGIYNPNGGAGKMDLRRFGIVQLNGGGEIVDFQEKPAQPKSSLIAMCIYFFPKESLHLFERYLCQNGRPDEPGNYISWLAASDKVYGYAFEGNWCDIGDIDAYSEAVFTF